MLSQRKETIRIGALDIAKPLFSIFYPPPPCIVHGLPQAEGFLLSIVGRSGAYFRFGIDLFIRPVSYEKGAEHEGRVPWIVKAMVQFSPGKRKRSGALFRAKKGLMDGWLFGEFSQILARNR